MLEQATAKPGYIRVRLRYVTESATTEAAVIMEDHLGVQGPYLEEIYILMPTQKVYTLLEAYKEAFEVLKAQGIVPQGSILQGIKVEVGEPSVLCYVL